MNRNVSRQFLQSFREAADPLFNALSKHDQDLEQSIFVQASSCRLSQGAFLRVESTGNVLGLALGGTTEMSCFATSKTILITIDFL